MTAKTPEDELRNLVIAIDDGELGRPRRVAELRQLLANSLDRITTLKRERDEAWRRGAEAMREAAAELADGDYSCGYDGLGPCRSASDDIRKLPLPTPEPEGE